MNSALENCNTKRNRPTTSCFSTARKSGLFRAVLKFCSTNRLSTSCLVDNVVVCVGDKSFADQHKYCFNESAYLNFSPTFARILERQARNLQ